MLIDEIVDFLAINKNESKIIGSYNDPNLKYFSDIDIQERVLHMSIPKFLSHVKSKVRDINKTPNFYFQDFKLGKFRDKQIKWTDKEILRGSKDFPTKREDLTLEELMYQKSMIKMDVVAYVKEYKRFVDFSINWYYIADDINTRPTFERDLKDEYRYEYFKNIESGDYLKAVKRLYKMAKVGDDYNMVKKIARFLNSRTGYLGLLRNSLDTLMNAVVMAKFNSWNLYSDEIRDLSSKFRSHGYRSIADELLMIRGSRDKTKIKEELSNIIMKLDSTYINPDSYRFIKTLDLIDFLE